VIISSHEKILYNIVIFVIRNGKPCNNGLQLLFIENKIPIIKDAILGRARIIIQEYLIAFATKIGASELLERRILKEALRSFYDVTLGLNLERYPFPKRI